MPPLTQLNLLTCTTMEINSAKQEHAPAICKVLALIVDAGRECIDDVLLPLSAESGYEDKVIIHSCDETPVNCSICMNLDVPYRYYPYLGSGIALCGICTARVETCEQDIYVAEFLGSKTWTNDIIDTLHAQLHKCRARVYNILMYVRILDQLPDRLIRAESYIATKYGTKHPCDCCNALTKSGVSYVWCIKHDACPYEWKSRTICSCCHARVVVATDALYSKSVFMLIAVGHINTTMDICTVIFERIAVLIQHDAELAICI